MGRAAAADSAFVCPLPVATLPAQVAASALASLPAWLTPHANAEPMALFRDGEALGDASLALWLAQTRSDAVGR